jgi:hypothetical protein
MPRGMSAPDVGLPPMLVHTLAWVQHATRTEYVMLFVAVPGTEESPSSLCPHPNAAFGTLLPDHAPKIPSCACLVPNRTLTATHTLPTTL